MVSVDASGMNASMNTVATAPSANAIGMPANITTRVATAYRIPIDKVVMDSNSSLPQLANRLQQQLKAQKSHADRHQGVGDPERWPPGRARMVIFGPGLLQQGP